MKTHRGGQKSAKEGRRGKREKGEHSDVNRKRRMGGCSSEIGH